MSARKSRLAGNPLDLLVEEPKIAESETSVSTKTIMVNTRLDPELVNRAKKVASLSGITLTDLIRRGVQREISQREGELIKSLKEELQVLEEKHRSKGRGNA